MITSAAQKHVVVVPVATLDEPTERALAYARTLAQRVVAVHLRRSDQHHARDIERVWARDTARVPLLVLDSTPGEWRKCFARVLDVLRGTEEADLVTVVLPPGSADVDRRERVVPAWAGALVRPGISVRSVPPGDDARSG